MLLVQLAYGLRAKTKYKTNSAVLGPDIDHGDVHPRELVYVMQVLYITCRVYYKSDAHAYAEGGDIESIMHGMKPKC